MSTRGLWGFKFHDEKKLTYNHSDSYPSGLGLKLKHQLSNYTIDRMKGRFDKIALVQPDAKPLPEIIEKLILYKYYVPSKFRKDELSEWYFLLRAWQGSMKPYLQYAMPIMVDGLPYIESTEYIYVIDLDDEAFIEAKSGLSVPLNNLTRDGNIISDNAFLRKMGESEDEEEQEDEDFEMPIDEVMSRLGIRTFI